MKISENGLSIIKQFEGLRLETYLDAVNVPTIGYGHTGSEVKLGQTIDGKEAARLLRQDCKECEDVINSVVKTPLTQNQFDALCSFIYNLGSGAFKSSTLLKRLNERKYEMAADEFLRWTFAGSKRLEGLVLRRRKERELFLKQV